MQRYPDDANLIDVKRVFQFQSDEMHYEILADPLSPDHVQVVIGNEVETWAIERKEKRDAALLISGGTIYRSALFVSDDSYWFEFFVGDEIFITYWGDKAVLRKDIGVELPS